LSTAQEKNAESLTHNNFATISHTFFNQNVLKLLGRTVWRNRRRL